MNTNTLRRGFAEIAEVFLLAWDEGQYDKTPTEIFILELVERCQDERIAELEKKSELRHKLMCLHHADAMELWEELADLSFECFGVTSCIPPSLDTYNRAFAILQKHRQAYSKTAREQVALQQAPSSQ